MRKQHGLASVRLGMRAAQPPLRKRFAASARQARSNAGEPLIVSRRLVLLLLVVERFDRRRPHLRLKKWVGCRSIVSNRFTDMRACNALLSLRLEHK